MGEPIVKISVRKWSLFIITILSIVVLLRLNFIFNPYNLDVVSEKFQVFIIKFYFWIAVISYLFCWMMYEADREGIKLD